MTTPVEKQPQLSDGAVINVVIVSDLEGTSDQDNDNDVARGALVLPEYDSIIGANLRKIRLVSYNS